MNILDVVSLLPDGTQVPSPVEASFKVWILLGAQLALTMVVLILIITFVIQRLKLIRRETNE